MEKLKLLEKYIEKPFVLLIFFIFCLTSINYLYCIIYTSDNFNFHLVDNDGNYILEKISFEFGRYLDEIINGKDITLSQFGIDLPLRGDHYCPIQYYLFLNICPQILYYFI